jgi:hypothetical protein
MSHKNYYQVGDFRPFLKNLNKYVNRGNKSLIARSGLEIRTFQKLDNLSSVISWSSETVYVPYQKPIFENKYSSTIILTDEHKYIIDCWLLWKKSETEMIEMLVEIKPKLMCYPPKQPKINNKKSWERYHESNRTYLINKYKWIATNEFCKKITKDRDRPLHFVIFTENEIIPIEKVLYNE